MVDQKRWLVDKMEILPMNWFLQVTIVTSLIMHQYNNNDILMHQWAESWYLRLITWIWTPWISTPQRALEKHLWIYNGMPNRDPPSLINTQCCLKVNESGNLFVITCFHLRYIHLEEISLILHLPIDMNPSIWTLHPPIDMNPTPPYRHEPMNINPTRTSPSTWNLHLSINMTLHLPISIDPTPPHQYDPTLPHLHEPYTSPSIWALHSHQHKPYTSPSTLDITCTCLCP